MSHIVKFVQQVLDLMPREGIATMDCPMAVILEAERLDCLDVLEWASGSLYDGDYEVAVLDLCNEVYDAIAERKEWALIRNRVLGWAESALGEVL